MTTVLLCASRSPMLHLTGYALINSQLISGRLASLSRVTSTSEGANRNRVSVSRNSVVKGESTIRPLSSTRLSCSIRSGNCCMKRFCPPSSRGDVLTVAPIPETFWNRMSNALACVPPAKKNTLKRNPKSGGLKGSSWGLSIRLVPYAMRNSASGMVVDLQAMGDEFQRFNGDVIAIGVKGRRRPFDGQGSLDRPSYHGLPRFVTQVNQDIPLRAGKQWYGIGAVYPPVQKIMALHQTLFHRESDGLWHAGEDMHAHQKTEPVFIGHRFIVKTQPRHFGKTDDHCLCLVQDGDAVIVGWQ